MAGSGFTTINSTIPCFNIDSTLATATYALETTARFWDKGGTNRAVRISSIDSNDFYVAFGSSDVTAAVGTSYLVPGGSVEIFDIWSNQDFIATISSTIVTFNVGLGRRVG